VKLFFIVIKPDTVYTIFWRHTTMDISTLVSVIGLDVRCYLFTNPFKDFFKAFKASLVN